MAGKAPMEFKTQLPPKRERVKRPVDGKPVIPLESSVNDDIYGAAKKIEHCKLWRNNRGVAQYGDSIVTYGVGPRGASDWIGYRRYFITAADVGKNIAQFVAIEAKRPGVETRDDQQRFLDQVKADGGCAGCATSGPEAKEILTSW